MPTLDNMPHLRSLYRNGLLSHNIQLNLLSCVDEKEVCSCGDKIFKESLKAIVKVTRLLVLSKVLTPVFNPQI